MSEEASKYALVGDVLTNIKIMPIRDDAIPVDAVLLIKAIEQDGSPAWFVRYSEGLYTIEALGALHAAIVLEEAKVQAIYTPEPEEDG